MDQNFTVTFLPRDQCTVPSDDDVASQGKGESLPESLGRSLHPDPMKVRRMVRGLFDRRFTLVTPLNSLYLQDFVIEKHLVRVSYPLLPWFLSE